MYNQYGSNEQSIADELAIQNMLTALANPAREDIFTDKEQEYIRNAIKTHILMNAKRVSDYLEPHEDEDSIDESMNDRYNSL